MEITFIYPSVPDAKRIFRRAGGLFGCLFTAAKKGETRCEARAISLTRRGYTIVAATTYYSRATVTKMLAFDRYLVVEIEGSARDNAGRVVGVYSRHRSFAAADRVCQRKTDHCDDAIIDYDIADWSTQRGCWESCYRETEPQGEEGATEMVVYPEWLR